MNIYDDDRNAFYFNYGDDESAQNYDLDGLRNDEDLEKHEFYQWLDQYQQEQSQQQIEWSRQAELVEMELRSVVIVESIIKELTSGRMQALYGRNGGK